MIIELKDCEKWIEDHKTYILPEEGGYARPMVSYGAKSLCETLNELVIPSFGCNEHLYNSMNEMLRIFWNEDSFYGGIQPLIKWMERRNAQQVIFDMMVGECDTEEIIEALYSVLRLDRKDANSPIVIKTAIEIYNNKSAEDAKIHDYEEILKGEIEQ